MLGFKLLFSLLQVKKIFRKRESYWDIASKISRSKIWISIPYFQKFQKNVIIQREKGGREGRGEKANVA